MAENATEREGAGVPSSLAGALSVLAAPPAVSVEVKEEGEEEEGEEEESDGDLECGDWDVAAGLAREDPSDAAM